MQERFRGEQGVMLAEKARGSTGQKATEARAQRESLLEAFKDGRQVVQDSGWPAWSPMVQTHERGSSFCADVGCDYSFANSRYQILVNFEAAPGWPPVVHLKIKAHDKRRVRDWRHMQRIKEDQYNAEGCLPRGQIEWPDWSPGNVSG